MLITGVLTSTVGRLFGNVLNEAVLRVISSIGMTILLGVIISSVLLLVVDLPRILVSLGARPTQRRVVPQQKGVGRRPTPSRGGVSGSAAGRGDHGAEGGGRAGGSGWIVTAAGVSAGIDMALWLAGQIAGDEVAKAIQLGIEYDPQPPFDSGSIAKASSETKELVRLATASPPTSA